MMKDTQDPSERRRFHRNSSPQVILIIDQVPYLAKDWSPAGFRIECTDNNYTLDQTIKGEIDIFELEEKGSFSARIVRLSENGDMACEFSQISSHAYIRLCAMLNAPEDR